MTAPEEKRARFIALSSALTGFTSFELLGTGQSESYLGTMERVAGTDNVIALLAAFQTAETASAGDGDTLDRTLRRLILSDDRLGPIARTLLKLWYVGTCYRLPRAWHDAYGGAPQAADFVVSPTAYTEGLLWPAIGANPPGAKPFGYGMWAMPPRVGRRRAAVPNVQPLIRRAAVPQSAIVGD